MNNDRDSNEQLEGFAEVIELLDKNLRYLESLGFGEATTQDYRKILSYLRSRSSSEVAKILGKNLTRRKPKGVPDPVLTDEEITQLRPEQIKKFLVDEKISRTFLEHLAALRFGVTKGALSTLRSRDALIEKVQTLLAHEGTHEAISRAASGQSGNVPSEEQPSEHPNLKS
ncbi:hypothetical protein E4Q08_13760 [Candidatus Accumulibacter phosphatis]|uniref:DUF1018 domain-containing protein n=1 Tax=Candidatus Accumulibacter contiguus TaxID=2954381 RepID=A0ABX1TDB0_9PROT|nr:hypothetical protein [Candidatus Accumulibacter contiguus]NMQ06237.1 hypothetical protein [Candidatus Accumulibacter contiguus]